MVLDETGFKIELFDQATAEALGAATGEEGALLLAEALRHRRTRIELRDWFYCLLQMAGTELRKRLADQPGKQTDTLIRVIEDYYEDDGDLGSGVPPERITEAVVAPEVLDMLARAEQMAVKDGMGRITHVLLSLALLETADDEFRTLLISWTTDEGYQKLLTALRTQSKPPSSRLREAVFQQGGSLSYQAFDANGSRLCRRLVEDSASMGARKITTRHVLYSLLSDESGALSLALAFDGLDVKKQVQSVLARELVRPGARRNDAFELTLDSMFDAVVQLFFAAADLAEAQERRISELDICRAFATRQPSELSRLSGTNRTIQPESLRSYLEAMELPEEEPTTPLHRFTIPEMEQRLKDRIAGQEPAIARILPWIKRLRFGLPRENRPAAVFLFTGPTGSGKTQMAKELAHYVYGSETKMVFMEMGQFQGKESVNMFIGAPPGYVGYGDGKLTNGLRDNPEAVILFDEIEKADTQVFDVLLRFADEGLISDPAGPVRDGRKCIIIMTSNAGQLWLRDHLQQYPDAIENTDTLAEALFAAAMEELKAKGFRPEFLGRVDERITFLPLSEAACRKIVDDSLDRELERFKKLKGITIDVPDNVRAFLAKCAHARSLEEGARGAPRAINQWIITPTIDQIAVADDEGKVLTNLIASCVGVDTIVLEALS